MSDSAMLQATVAVLGIGHPTGYPTYTMIGKLFTYLPVGDMAYRVNLLSAFSGAAAVLFTYLAGLRLTGRAVAAAVGALSFGLAPVFWGQAVIAEVYTMNAALISLELWLLLAWRDARREGLLLLFALVSGLALTHHVTSALLVPVGLAFVFAVDRHALARWKLLLRGAGLFLAGLLSYLYLPLRAATEPPLNEADPSTPGRFLMLVTGGGYVQRQLVDDGGSGSGAGARQLVIDALGRMYERLTGEYFLGQFPVVLMLVGVVGIGSLLFRDRSAALLLGIPFAGWSVHGLLYTFVDFYVFFIPAYLVFGLFVARGAGFALRGMENVAGSGCSRMALAGALPVAALSVILIVTPLLEAPETYRAVDRSGDYRGREIIDTVARKAEPGATVLHHRSNLWYMVLVEQRRRDLTLVDPFNTAWVRHTDMVWPAPVDRKEAAARYGTDDETGVETARKASRRGPVYLLNQDGLDTSAFERAGFEVRPAGENGILYRLVPEDRG